MSWAASGNVLPVASFSPVSLVPFYLVPPRQVRGVPHLNAFSKLLMDPDEREISVLKVEDAGAMVATNIQV